MFRELDSEQETAIVTRHLLSALLTSFGFYSGVVSWCPQIPGTGKAAEVHWRLSPAISQLNLDQDPQATPLLTETLARCFGCFGNPSYAKSPIWNLRRV